MVDEQETERPTDAATPEENLATAALIAALQAQIAQLEQQLAELKERGLSGTPTTK